MQNYDKKYYTKANSRRQIVGIERMKQFCNIDCFILLDRDKNTKRRYGRAWKRIRDKYAAEHPFCEKCYERGVLVPVEEIHHKLPLSEGAHIIGVI